jgi:cytochrome c-type biogenesis protein CcsB
MRIFAIVAAALVILGAVIALGSAHLLWTPEDVYLVPRVHFGFADTYVLAERWRADPSAHPALTAALERSGLTEPLHAAGVNTAAPNLHTLRGVEVSLFWFILYGFIAASAFYIAYVIWRRRWMGAGGTAVVGLNFAAATLLLVVRTLEARHVPYANLYEFMVSFMWALTLFYLIFERVAAARGMNIKPAGAVVMPVGVALLVFMARLPHAYRSVESLMPALKSNWLIFHVITGVIGYGAAAVAFGMAIWYLLRRGRQPGPQEMSQETLDDLMYQCVRISFPFLTLLLITGAVWGRVAWSRYWGWDPKETASLVTWLVYLVYMHARLLRGWRGAPAALLLVIGFGSVIFTFLGVSVLEKYKESLHGYAAGMGS